MNKFTLIAGVVGLTLGVIIGRSFRVQEPVKVGDTPVPKAVIENQIVARVVLGDATVEEFIHDGDSAEFWKSSSLRKLEDLVTKAEEEEPNKLLRLFSRLGQFRGADVPSFLNQIERDYLLPALANTAFEQMAKTDRFEAARLASEGSPVWRNMAIKTVFEEWARTAPHDAYFEAGRVRGVAENGIARKAAANGIQKHAREVSLMMLEVLGKDGLGSASGALMRLAQRDAGAAVAALSKLDESARSGGSGARIFSQVFRDFDLRDGISPEIETYLGSLPEDLVVHAKAGLAQSMLALNPPEALALVESFEKGMVRDELLKRISWNGGGNQPEVILHWINDKKVSLSRQERRQILTGTLSSWVRSNPTAAFNWASENDDPRSRLSGLLNRELRTIQRTGF